jgi:hypothetical protein
MSLELCLSFLPNNLLCQQSVENLKTLNTHYYPHFIYLTIRGSFLNDVTHISNYF